MTILFTEGFDLYGTTTGKDIETRWAFATTPGNLSSAVTPVSLGQSFFFQNGSTSSAISPTFTAASSFTIGFAFRSAALGGVSGSVSSNPHLQLRSTATYMVGLQFNSDGSIGVFRSSGAGAGTMLGTSAAGLILVNTWYYVEFSVSISDTVGTVSVNVNGANALSLTSQDTRNGTPTTVDNFILGAGGSNSLQYYDDIYVSDSTTPLGPQRIVTLRPNLDTAQKDWTPLSGANNSAMVGEATSDGDTSYVQSGTVGNFDLYDAANLSSTVTIISINAVNHVVFARKNDLNTKQIVLTTKSSSTTTNSANIALSTSYMYYNNLYNTDPATSSAWTASSVNSLQIGQKVTV